MPSQHTGEGHGGSGVPGFMIAMAKLKSKIAPSLYAQGIVNKKSLNFLIDSGAVVSILSEDCAKKLNVGSLQKATHKLIGASGTNLEVVGSLNNVVVTLGGTSFIVDFIVVRNLVTSAVLGSDFLINNGITCDFGKMLLSKGNTNMNIPLLSNESSKPEILVATKSDITFTGTREISCSVSSIDSNLPVNNGLYLYQPNAKFWGPVDDDFSQDDVETCLVKVDKSRLTICAALADQNAELYIPAGTVVGKLKPVDSIVNNVQQVLTPEQKKILVFSKLKIDDNTNMSQPQKQQMKDLVSEFIDVFSENKFDIGYTDMMEAEIKLNNGDEPIFQPYRRAPIHLLPKVSEEIEKLLELGVIKESQSPFNTATVIVKKPDGSVRIAVDYRALNKATVSITAPLPPIDMVTAQVGGKKFYSKMDLTRGYYAIPIKKSDTYKTAWSIPGLGAYEFLRLALGLRNAPAYFCRLLTRLFRGLDHVICFIYLDDILTSSDTFEDMIHKLRLVFERLRLGKLKISPDKCEFMASKVKFLGSYISQEGYQACVDKVKAILELNFPETKKKLQSFIGMCSWYRPFISSFAAVMSPLTDLLKGSGHVLSPTIEAKLSFEAIKEKLTSMEVMILPQLDKPLVIYCDASFRGLGCCIGHVMETDKSENFRPVAYASRVLTTPESKWPSFKLEMRCIYYALNKWEHLIYGSSLKTVVYTDMLALTSPNYLNKTNCRLLLSWAMKLSEFDFELRHVKGLENSTADYLSRAPLGSNDIWDYWVRVIKNQEQQPSASVVLNIIKESIILNNDLLADPTSPDANDQTLPDGYFENPLPVSFSNFGMLFDHQLLDGPLKNVRSWLVNGSRPAAREASGLDKTSRVYFNKFQRLMFTKQNLVAIKYWGNKSQKFRLLVCIPDSLMKETILLNHEKNGHPGVERCMKMLRQTVWWPEQYLQVTLHVKSCEQCFFFNEGFRPKPRMFMSVYDQRNSCNSRLYCDTMGPIYNDRGVEKHILLVTCAFSKYVSGIVLTNILSITIAKALLNCHILIFGCPEQIITDQGSSIHASEVIQQLYQLLNIDKDKISAYHPQSNLTERSNKSIKAVISKLTHECPNKWPQYLPVALFSYNNTINKSTGFSPGYLFFGRQMRNAHDIYFGTTSTKFFRDQSHYACNLYWELREVYGLVTEALQRQQLSAKKLYDKKACRTEYKIGDYVALFMPLPASERANNKFKTRLRVLFRIVKVISDHNFLIENLETKKLKVVHHDLLRLLEHDLATKISRKLKLPAESDMCHSGVAVKHSENAGPAITKPSLAAQRNSLCNSKESSRSYDDDSDDDDDDYLQDFDVDRIKFRSGPPNAHLIDDIDQLLVGGDQQLLPNVGPDELEAGNDVLEDIHPQPVTDDPARLNRDVEPAEDENDVVDVGLQNDRPVRNRRLPDHLRDYHLY